MHPIIWFLLGMVVGSFVGILTICLLQAAKDDTDEIEFDQHRETTPPPEIIKEARWR